MVLSSFRDSMQRGLLCYTYTVTVKETEYYESA